MADVLLVGWLGDWLFDVWLPALELPPVWSPLQRVETIGAVVWLGRDGTNLGLGIRMGWMSNQASIATLIDEVLTQNNKFLVVEEDLKKHNSVIFDLGKRQLFPLIFK